MKKIILCCAAATLLFGACKKSDSGGSASKTSILTSGKWVEIAETTQRITGGVAGPLNDEFAGKSSCEKDDYTYFKSDKTIIIDEGATKCNSSDPQIYTVGSWDLLSGDTKLRQSNPVLIIDWDIDQLDDNTLKITYSETSTTGSTTVVDKSSSTFKHIN